MTFEIHLAFCVMVVLTGSSQTRVHSYVSFTGQITASPPVLTPADLLTPAGSSASPHLTENPGDEVPQPTHDPAGRDEASDPVTAITQTKGTVHSETWSDAVHKTRVFTTSSAAAASQHTSVPAVMTASPTAAADGLSSTPTAWSTAATEGLLTGEPLTTFSSQPGQAERDSRSTFQPQFESLTTATAQTTTTGRPLTPATGRRPEGPTHQKVPSELNVGDKELKGPHASSPLDPLLAGLLSVFIVTTAIVFVILFLKFRQRTNHPEFHRLQDLPMDDLMEDTPLSRYSY